MQWLRHENWQGNDQDIYYLLQRWHDAAIEIFKHEDPHSWEPAFEAAKDKTGFVCIAAKILLDDRDKNSCSEIGKALECLINIARDYKDRQRMKQYVKVIRLVHEHAVNNVFWVHAGSAGCSEDYYNLKKDTVPGFRVTLPELLEDDMQPQFYQTPESLIEEGTESQKKVLQRMWEISLIRQAKFTMPIPIRTNMLLVGMSGSGKSWVMNQYSKIVRMPSISTTVGSWILRGNNNATSTLDIVFKQLKKWPLCICIDEVDKFRQTSKDNQNYFRAVLDEIMALLDNRLEMFSAPNAVRDNLHRSYIIAAGAFQDLYREKIGKDGASFIEEVTEMPPLTMDDIVAAGWLPDELLGRMAAQVLEVRPPGVEEMVEIMSNAELCVGVKADPRYRLQVARDAVLNCKGLRKVESFVLEIATQKAIIDHKNKAGGGKSPSPGKF